MGGFVDAGVPAGELLFPPLTEAGGVALLPLLFEAGGVALLPLLFGVFVFPPPPQAVSRENVSKSTITSVKVFFIFFNLGLSMYSLFLRSV